MNGEILRDAPEHVREEFEKLRELNGCLERAVQLAVPYLRGQPPHLLPGDPPPANAPEHEWVEYLTREGARAVEEARGA